MPDSYVVTSIRDVRKRNEAHQIAEYESARATRKAKFAAAKRERQTQVDAATEGT